jgi:hypothetical protein
MKKKPKAQQQRRRIPSPESAQRNKSIIIYKHEQYKISIIFKLMEGKKVEAEKEC